VLGGEVTEDVASWVEERGMGDKQIISHVEKDGAKTLEVIVITIHCVAYVYEAKFLVQAFSLPDWNFHF